METLSFEKGNATLTLPELSKTIRLELAKGGLPKNRPTEHFHLIDSIFEQVNSGLGTGMTADLEPIHVHESYAKRIMWQGEKEACPVDKYLIDRVVTRIMIHRNNESALNQALAISYNERGIQVALGTNVHVCANMNIFGSNIISTFGANRTPFDKLMDVVKLWIKDLHGYYKNDIHIIK